MTQCLHLTGFLTRLPCGEPATGVCASCGKLICQRHQVPHQGGISCPDCVVSSSDTNRDHSGTDDHSLSNYSSNDYSDFEETTGGGGEMDGGGASGGWDEGGDSANILDDSGGEGAGAFQDS